MSNKHKLSMDQAIDDLAELERMVQTIRRKVVIYSVEQVELDSIVADLDKLVEFINNRRTLAQNWRWQAGVNGVDVPEETNDH